MAPTPGLLYVTMQPKPTLSEPQFHDWYNNEHGPTRLRLPFITNGFRYRARDVPPSDGNPEWMALYDITDMAELTKDAYLRLREPPAKSQREVDIMKQITIDRRLYDFVEERKSLQFKELEKVENEGSGNVMAALCIRLKDEKGREELDKWYREEHIDLLSKVPGWLRTRRYMTSSIDSKAPMEYLALHEFAPNNGLGEEKPRASLLTKWRSEIMSKLVAEQNQRVYNLYYTFGPALRYLSSQLSSWHSSDQNASLTMTTPSSPGGNGTIESFITTPDGVELNYRLEGSADPDAPLILLSNCILVNYGIWDSFIASFFSTPSNQKYRILRYQTRGRHSSCGTRKINMDLLSSDIIVILDALRVKKAAAIIGVSLGGATVLNTALKYPARVSSFVSCDTSSASPANNAKAWSERIAISESENASLTDGTKIVGEQLAEMTTRRWFVKESYEDIDLKDVLLEVKNMVRNNSLGGFKKSVEALWEYDLKEEMKSAEVRGLFVVGGGDGVLPATMKSMSEAYGKNGAGYEVIEGAGHLPMVEKPVAFSNIVTKFLD